MEEKKHLQTLLVSGKFIFSIVLLFLAFSLFFSFFPLEWFELFYAFGTLEILKLFGFSGEIIFREPVLLKLDIFRVPLGFSYLCTGLLELAVVWAAVLSSFGIGLRKRIDGFFAAAIVLVAFNFFRIVASVLAIYFFGLEAGSFSHDLLFRFFLFATIGGFYYFWFELAVKSPKKGKGNG